MPCVAHTLPLYGQTRTSTLVSVAKPVGFRASRVIAQGERGLRRAFNKRGQGDGGPTRPLHL
jgi:hypothetical protein